MSKIKELSNNQTNFILFKFSNNCAISISYIYTTVFHKDFKDTMFELFQFASLLKNPDEDFLFYIICFCKCKSYLSMIYLLFGLHLE